MWTKYFLLSIVILVIAISGLAVTWIPLGNVTMPVENIGWICSKLLNVANLMAIYYLYRFGQFRHSHWKRWMFLLIAAFIIAAVCKIQHWPITNMISPIPFLGTPILYATWFYTKPTKHINDYLKLLWVVIHFLFSWFEFMHWFSLGVWITILSTGLLQLVYIQFYELQKHDLLVKKIKWDFHG